MQETITRDRIPSILDQLQSDLPEQLGAPARRALIVAGIWRLEQLTALREAEVKSFHGIGPNALKQLQQALASRGLGFRV